MRALGGLLVTILLLFGAAGVSAAPPVCKPHECGVPSPSPTPAPTPRSVGMGRLVTSGAETADTTIESVTLTAGATAASISTANPRSGARHYRTNAASTTSYIQYTAPATVGVTYYARAYVYAASDPGLNSFGQSLMRLVGAGSTMIASLDDFGSSIANVPVTWPGYNRLELSWSWSGTNITLAAQINGVSTGTYSFGANIAPTFLWIGWVTSAIQTATNIDIDDVAINDSAGAAQNTWPGDGKEVLLLPVTDNATGTGWTLGTGTAAGTAVHTAVANTPPLGVADLAVGSDVKQVRNATANANVNVDQNMTTYSAAGIVAADTINVIDPITVTGAPVVTSAKLGTVGVVSNPAITSVNLAAGGTSGAFWSGVAAGTYPTGWKVSHGTLTYGSSVTVGTAPVMRVQQVTSSTRIAIVSFMGMYVDYTPAVVARVPYSSPYPQILSH